MAAIPLASEVHTHIAWQRIHNITFSFVTSQGHFLTSSSNRAEKFLRKRCLKTSLRDFLFFPRIAIHALHGKHCQYKIMILLLNS